MLAGMRTAALFAALALMLPLPALADASADAWDATWVGDWDAPNDNGVQVIVAGGQVLGFFVNGDYLVPASTSPVAADGSLTFTWDKGHATLKLDGDKHELVVDETGQAERVIELTADQ